MDVEGLYNESFWDDIDVGNFNLNTSENFFANRHFNHERIDIKENINKMNKKTMNKENDRNVTNKLNAIGASNEKVKKPIEEITMQLKECVIKTEESETECVPEEVMMAEPQGPITRAKLKAINQQQSNATESVKTKPNLLTSFSNWKKTTAVTSSCKDNSSLHQYAKKYADKKAEKLAKILEDERQARQFHSKPPPNFNKIHKQVNKKLDELKKLPTCPTSPLVLKSSREMKEKQLKKMEEYIRRQKPSAFVAKDCDVIKKKPYKPKLETRMIQPSPFDLHSNTRSQQRKLFDRNNRQVLEEKERQRVEEQRIKEIEEQKKIRKMTQFRAKPNPFKSA